MADPAIDAAQRAYTINRADATVWDEAVTAAREALEPIRAKHKPITIKCIESVCALGECDHDDDTCPENIPVKVCAECWEIADSINSYHSEEGIVDELLWPCGTAQLIYATEELER